LEEVRREFSGLPVYVGVEDGYVYVKVTAPMDKKQFRRYLETCKRLGFRFDRRGERWVELLEKLKVVWIFVKKFCLAPCRGFTAH